jgi:hypothetical protein
MFFSKLINMVCTFEDYLGPLAAYAQASDVDLDARRRLKTAADSTEL